MKKYLMFAASVLVAAQLMAQYTVQVAVPVTPRLEKCDMNESSGNNMTVKALLLTDADKACGMSLIPSFDFLSSIMLYPDTKELVYRKAKEKITDQTVQEGVPMETSKIVLTYEQCSVIKGLFDAAVGSARDKVVPKPGEIAPVMLDGESYYFFSEGMAGKCWSPYKDDLRALLVNLTNEMCRYVRNHRPLSDELIAQAKELSVRFTDE